MSRDLGGLNCRYGITENSVISYKYIEGKSIEVGKSHFEYENNNSDEHERAASFYHEFALLRNLLLALKGDKSLLIEGGEGAMYLATMVLYLQGVTQKQTAEILGTRSIVPFRYLEYDVPAIHGDFEEYMAHMGLGSDEFAYFRNILGKQELSAGAVVMDEVSGIFMVEHMKAGHYSLPKGHVELVDGGSLKATAIREIKEETGLDVEINENIHESISYSPHEGAVKKVVFFLAYSHEQPLNLQKSEVTDAFFLEPAMAYRFLTHDSDREAFQSIVMQYIDSQKS